MALQSPLRRFMQPVLQNMRSVRARPHSGEPMFDSKTKIRNRLVDTFDLVVDFATLGEYGLEPLEAAEEACAGGRCDHDGRRAGWEAATTPRRGSCGSQSATRLAVCTVHG